MYLMNFDYVLIKHLRVTMAAWLAWWSRPIDASAPAAASASEARMRSVA